MSQDLLFFQQLFGTASGMVQATLLAGLLVVLVFRPDKIRNRALFTWACWCFALSILLPPLLNLFFVTLGSGVFGGMGRSPLVMLGSTIGGPGLLGLSLLFTLLSLMPGPQGPLQPPRHPLE